MKSFRWPRLQRKAYCHFKISGAIHFTGFEQDEDVDRTESDTLNGFPPKKLTLQPGGCAYYEFPIQPGEINSYIQPAKKQGEIYWVYKIV